MLTAAAPTTGGPEHVGILLSDLDVSGTVRAQARTSVSRFLRSSRARSSRLVTPQGSPPRKDSRLSREGRRAWQPHCAGPRRRGRAGRALGPRPTERRPRRAEPSLVCPPRPARNDPRHDVSRRPRVAPTAGDPTTCSLGRVGEVRRLLGEPRAPLAEFRPMTYSTSSLSVSLPRNKRRAGALEESAWTLCGSAHRVR